MGSRQTEFTPPPGPAAQQQLLQAAEETKELLSPPVPVPTLLTRRHSNEVFVEDGRVKFQKDNAAGSVALLERLRRLGESLAVHSGPSPDDGSAGAVACSDGRVRETCREKSEGHGAALEGAEHSPREPEVAAAVPRRGRATSSRFLNSGGQHGASALTVPSPELASALEALERSKMRLTGSPSPLTPTRSACRGGGSSGSGGGGSGGCEASSGRTHTSASALFEEAPWR